MCWSKVRTGLWTGSSAATSCRPAGAGLFPCRWRKDIRPRHCSHGFAAAGRADMATAAPSLTLRALLSRAGARAGLDRPSGVVAGLTPAGKALSAVLAARPSRGVTLLVVPTDTDVEQMTSDARFFFSALEG